jgi:hypothetical protein
LYLENITIEGKCGASFRCNSMTKTDTTPRHMELFARNARGLDRFTYSRIILDHASVGLKYMCDQNTRFQSLL